VFQTLAASLASAALSALPGGAVTTSPAQGGAVAAAGAAALLAGGHASAVADAAVKIRENLVLRRAITLCADAAGGVVCGYTHGAASPGVGAIGVLVALAPAAAGAPPLPAPAPALRAIGKRLAMHVAAAKPCCVGREDVPPDALERERAVVAAQVGAGAAGKAPEVVERMAAGRLAKFYADVALLEQPFALPEEGEKARRVDAWLAGAAKAAGLPPLRVLGFVHFAIGGGGGGGGAPT
jgi:elongation factor Ts